MRVEQTVIISKSVLALYMYVAKHLPDEVTVKIVGDVTPFSFKGEELSGVQESVITVSDVFIEGVKYKLPPKGVAYIKEIFIELVKPSFDGNQLP